MLLADKDSVERVARALFHARPIKVRGASGWASMDEDTKQLWRSLAIAALDMTHGAQLRMGKQ